jgi:chromosome segregation ATPase
MCVVRRFLCGLTLAACGLLLAPPQASAEDEKQAAEKQLKEAAAQLDSLLNQVRKQEQGLVVRQRALEGATSDLDALKTQLKKLQDEVAKKQAEIAAAEKRLVEEKTHRALEETRRAETRALNALEARQYRYWLADGKQAGNLPPGVTVTQKDGKLIIEIPLPKESKPEAKPNPELKPKPNAPGASTGWQIAPSKPGEKVTGKLELELKPAQPGAPGAVTPRIVNRYEAVPTPKASVEDRISALEKKLNALLEELRALRKQQPDKNTGALKKEVEGRIIIVND